NLCHSDQLILEEFSLWLQKVRTRTGVVATKENETYLTEEVFRTWHERHLLAYLDIAFWARLSETQLGNERIGAALYGPTAETKKRMEKNAKEALRLISKHNLEALTKLVMRRRAMG
ncbi:MAG: hypothetical protein J0M19_14030, partial [Sphingomonadales bacterium]|nr:hypothetical protein [Sphingomonadales bacterium]